MTRPSVRDLLLAAAVGLLFGVSPFTPADLTSSAAAGIAAAIAFLAYRARRARGPAPASGPPEVRTQAPGVMVWVCLVLFAAVFAPTLPWMYREWTGSIWHNNHGLLIPPLMLLLAGGKLREGPPSLSESSAWGLAPVALGLALAVLAAAAETHILASIGIVIAIPGLCLLFLGARRTWALRLPLLLGVFMVPLPADLSGPMQLRVLTAAGAELLLGWLGVPVLRNHTRLELADWTLLVGDPCSGFAALMAAAAATLILTSVCRSPLRRALLVLCCVPLALAVNILRILVLALLGLYIGPWLLDTPLHSASGVAVFGIVVLALIALAGRSPLPMGFPTSPVSPRYTGPLLALIVAALVPVALFTSSPPRTDDCASPAALMDPRLWGIGESASSERPSQGEPGDPLLKLSGDLRVSGVQLSFRVVRSFGLPTLFFQPIKLFPEGGDPDQIERRRLALGATQFPVTFAYGVQGAALRFTAYGFVHRSQPVENPLLARVFDAPAALVRGASPITLLAVSGRSSPEDVPRARELALDWMSEAWPRYENACSR